MTTYRIMTFDGGGTLGALSLQLLSRLVKQNPKLISQTHVFSGTSIGSFTALALASGRSLQETFQYFKEKILPAFSISRPGGPVFNQQLPYSGFIKAVRNFFPSDLRLKNLKKRIVVPAFKLYSPELDRWTPVLFHNFPGSPYLNEKVSDVILRSSGAPATQRAYQNYVDGYVVAANPSTPSIAFAVGKANVPLDEIAVLSIGTGEAPTRLRRDTRGWGMVSADNIRPKNLDNLPPNWGVLLNRAPNEPLLPFLSVVGSGSGYYETMVSSNLLGDRFFRLNPRIPSLSLTDPSVVPVVIEIANKTNLQPVLRFIEENWSK
ncbi:MULTISPECIES: patatin-like phospholipase family protein [Bacillus]|uniref:patatin-like phospholipase family protein n=1 Tax=Bacillus TaxID=1386 RepID=UPI0015828A51|nr:patatin-like phospholipase family protein [Bacillus glycinifermentans]MBU8785810.1 patatin-like phospholipase family protein [Bacillus glycinifermentans]NUJ15653.1 protein teg [Bacillus glycinifermentans]